VGVAFNHWGTLPPMRDEQHNRHNHCLTSPVYRAKCREMNTRLAKRYANHPALALWHVSNEYSGACYCPLCFAAFREWLKKKYGTLDALNAAWWSHFWAHTYTSWEQVVCIDGCVEGLRLDWKRFTCDQTVDFFLAECAPLREHTPGVSVCINNMGFFEDMDYWRFAPHVDVVTFDSYPDNFDKPDPEDLAAKCATWYDLQRSLGGGKPFLLMESSPGVSNWMNTRLQRPGVHRMKSLQAVAHGADSVQYFQIRKGRGGCEKYHGAVIDHAGAKRAPDTRVFQEVSQVGKDLKALAPVLGATTPARVAILSDWESRWSLNMAAGPSAHAKDTLLHLQHHHRPFWKRGVAVDIVNGDNTLEGYDVVVAPSLYLLRKGFAEHVEKFVAAGGVFVATWLTGVVEESGLVFHGGLPGPIAKLLGVWSEEIDYLYDEEANQAVFADGNVSGLRGAYELKRVCEVVHAEGAEVAAVYGKDFYAGKPCVTVNKFGKGEAWYIAADGGRAMLDDFYAKLIARKNLPRALADDQPEGVAAQVRANANGVFTFVTNHSNKEVEALLGAKEREDVLTGKRVAGKVVLPPYGVMVLKK